MNTVAQAFIEFTVYGKPQPAGSKRAWVPRDRHGQPFMKNGRIIANTVDDNPKSRDWKNAVASAAREAYQGPLLTGPIKLHVGFLFARAKGHYGSGRNCGVLKASAPKHHLQKPDATKLVRAVEDALTGVVWRGDEQVVDQHVSKHWAEDGKPACCYVVIECESASTSENRRWR